MTAPLHYVGTVASPRPVAEVHDYLARFDNVAEWDPSIVAAEQLDDGPPGVGSRFRIRLRFLGRESSLDYDLVNAEPPHLLVFRAETDAIRSLDTISFRSLPDGRSEVTYEAALELKGVRRLFAPIAGLAFRLNNRRAEAELRERLGG